LLAPLRLPERVIDALDSLAEAAREVSPMRSELTRVREQTEPLAELMPAVERLIERLQELIVALEGDESHLSVTARKLVDHSFAMHKTVDGLKDDVRSGTERLPDASKGPLEKARDVLTGGAADPSS
jgi:predicted nuclease with TOPRIM domain